MTPDLAQILQDPGQVATLSPAEARGLLLQLAPLVEDLRLRALTNHPPGGENGQSDAAGEGDRLLTVEEAAARLGLSQDYLYRHAKALPFTVRIPPRQLRFSLRGIERYIRQRSGR